jgi:hypothetical protein
MLSNSLFLILILTFIIGIGITNSSNGSNIAQFLSYKYPLALAQTTSSSPKMINNQTQQPQQERWVDKVQ